MKNMEMHRADLAIPDQAFNLVRRARDPIASAVAVMGMMAAIIEVKNGTAATVELMREMAERMSAEAQGRPS